jgi:hypothetical protein
MRGVLKNPVLANGAFMLKLKQTRTRNRWGIAFPTTFPAIAVLLASYYFIALICASSGSTTLHNDLLMISTIARKLMIDLMQRWRGSVDTR